RHVNRHPGVLVIDIGSSTIDCSVVHDGTAAEHPASADFGLGALDERIYQEYLDRHPHRTDRLEQYENDPPARNLMPHPCRLHKERAVGGQPDVAGLLAQRDCARREWELLSAVDVPVLIEEPEGWLQRYRNVLAALAADPALAAATVLLTGGGARIPAVIDA